MKRRTQNARLAMERLAAHMPGVVIEPCGARLYVLRGCNTSSIDRPLNAKRCLARLVTIALWHADFRGWGMTRKEIRDVIRLTKVTAHGTAAHEEQSIRDVLTA